MLELFLANRLDADKGWYCLLDIGGEYGGHYRLGSRGVGFERLRRRTTRATASASSSTKSLQIPPPPPPSLQLGQVSSHSQNRHTFERSDAIGDLVCSSFSYEIIFSWNHFQTFWSLFILYKQTFYKIYKVSELSGNFPDGLKSTILWGNSSDCLGTFQAVQKFSNLNGNFPDYPETFQIIWKLSRLSGNFPHYPETFQIVWNLPDFLVDPEMLSRWTVAPEI